MEIAVIALGSRGDVQPFLALARGLRHVGHRVRLIAPKNFAPLVEGYGVTFAPIDADFQALTDDEQVRQIAESGRLITQMAVLRRRFLDVLDALQGDVWRGCQGAEAIISTLIGPVGHGVAQKLGVPYIEAAMQPVTPTRAFSTPALPPRALGGVGNWLSHLLFEQGLWQLYRTSVNSARVELLGLPPYPLAGPVRAIRTGGGLRLYAFSRHVVPRPADWPASHHVTGYWFLPPPPGWQPEQALVDFLAAGPPPVYVGFGSMTSRDPQQTTELVLEALRRSGQRAVLLGGWGALNGVQSSADLFYLEHAQHSWLFPQLAAIVHHGGAGTTAAALRSGVPAIVVPFGFDQVFWGQRGARLGVGSPPLPRRTLTADALAAAIDSAVNDAQLRQRAAALGSQIQAEQGVASAIDLIHRAVGQRERIFL